MKRGMALAVTFLWSAGTVFSQEPQATIRIQVRAGSSPVQTATVNVNDVPHLTDREGSVTGAVALGQVRVTVTKEGFLTATTSLMVDAAREWQVEVELRSADSEEEEVTVYATRSDRRLQDSALRVEALQREEIEEKMLMTPGDIVMMLNEMGGMRVQTTSPSLGAASVRVQGMRGRYTRFLSDGLPLFGQQGAGLGLLQIPPMDLGQVEVIKGNASALYGGSAMAGVINLLSRRPKDEPVHELLVNRSSIGTTDVPLFLASRLSSHWSGSLLAGGHWQEANDRDKDGWADLAGYGRGIARPRFYWDGGNGRTALLTSGFTYENRTGGTMPGSVLPSTQEPYTEALNTRRYDFGANTQFLIDQRYVVSTRFSASTQSHRHQFGEILERDRHDLLFGETSLRGVTGRHTWVVGAAAERDSYRPMDVTRFAYTYVTPGVFAQDDIDIAPWLSVSASARADFQNRYGTFFSPRISALIRWLGWTSRASAGQGFFAPTPLSEETEAAGLSRLNIPVLLVAEKGRSTSVDLTRNMGPFSFTTTFFRSSIRNPLYVERGERYEIINLAKPTTNLGMEFLATWRKSPFAATASYTYVHSHEEELEGLRRDIPLTPRHSFGLVGVWEKESIGRLGVEGYYTGTQRLEHNPYRDTSRQYMFFGIMGERKFGRHLRLFLNLENLTNVRQTRWDSLLRPTRGADGRWTVDAWAPLDGRVLNGGIRVVF